MTQFSPTPRIPRQIDPKRLRRFSSAFQGYGGSGSQNVTMVFSKRGIEAQAANVNTDTPSLQVTNSTGTSVVEIGDAGVSSPDRNLTVLSSNTTLAANAINQILSVSPSSTLKVTLNSTSDVVSGTWLGFQDVSGNAGQHNIIVDPNTSGSGFTINGGSAPVTVVDSSYGIGFIRLLREPGNTNWFVEQSRGTVPRLGDLVSVSVNTTLVYPQALAKMSTAGGDRKFILPDAALYENSMIILKKTTTDSNLFIVEAAVGQTIDSQASISSNLVRRSFGVFSDGSDWWVFSGSGT